MKLDIEYALNILRFIEEIEDSTFISLQKVLDGINIENDKSSVAKFLTHLYHLDDLGCFLTNTNERISGKVILNIYGVFEQQPIVHFRLTAQGRQVREFLETNEIKEDVKDFGLNVGSSAISQIIATAASAIVL